MSEGPLRASAEAANPEPLPSDPEPLPRPVRSGWRRKVQEEFDRMAAVVALIARKDGEEEYCTGVVDLLDQLEVWLDGEEAKDRGKRFVRTERTGLEEKYLEAYEELKAKLAAAKKKPAFMGDHAADQDNQDSGGNAVGLLEGEEGG